MKSRSSFFILTASMSGLIAHATPTLANEWRPTLNSRWIVSQDDDSNNTQAFINTLEAEYGWAVSDNWQAHTHIQLRSDAKDFLEPGEPDDSVVRSNASSRLFLSDHAEIELREAFIDGYIGNAFVRVGKQQVVWGKADGFRVLDVVNPMNMREFILEEAEDRRIPTWLLNVEIPIGDWNWQGLWIPDTTYDQTPSIQQSAAFAPSSSRLVPNFQGYQSINSIEAERPNNLLSDGDAGMRLTGFISGWDVSLNYLYHYLDNAVPYQAVFGQTVSSQTLPSQTLPDPKDVLTITPVYERSHLIGAAAANAFGSFAVRTEIAYNSHRFFLTEEVNAFNNGIEETPEITSVIGLDYSGISDTFISAQWFLSYLTDASEKLTRPTSDSIVTLLAERKFINQTLTLKGQCFHSINDNDGLVRLSLTYEWLSNLEITTGIDRFYGTEDGVFGQYDSQDRWFISLEYSL